MDRNGDQHMFSKTLNQHLFDTYNADNQFNCSNYPCRRVWARELEVQKNRKMYDQKYESEGLMNGYWQCYVVKPPNSSSNANRSHVLAVEYEING